MLPAGFEPMFPARQRHWYRRKWVGTSVKNLISFAQEKKEKLNTKLHNGIVACKDLFLKF
jgi:hypothetical protein